MFKNIGGVAFGLMLPVLAGFIGMAIGDRPALALRFVGGMLAANGKVRIFRSTGGRLPGRLPDPGTSARSVTNFRMLLKNWRLY